MYSDISSDEDVEHDQVDDQVDGILTLVAVAAEVAAEVAFDEPAFDEPEFAPEFTPEFAPELAAEVVPVETFTLFKCKKYRLHCECLSSTGTLMRVSRCKLIHASYHNLIEGIHFFIVPHPLI